MIQNPIDILPSQRWVLPRIHRYIGRLEAHEEIDDAFWRFQLPIATMTFPTVYGLNRLFDAEQPALVALSRFNTARATLLRRIDDQLVGLRHAPSLRPAARSLGFSRLQQLRLQVRQANNRLPESDFTALRQPLSRYRQTLKGVSLHRPGLAALLAETPWLQQMMGLTPHNPLIKRLPAQPARFMARFYQRSLLMGKTYTPGFFRRMIADLSRAGQLRSLLRAGAVTLGLLGMFETQREMRHAAVGQP